MARVTTRGKRLARWHARALAEFLHGKECELSVAHAFNIRVRGKETRFVVGMLLAKDDVLEKNMAVVIAATSSHGDDIPVEGRWVSLELREGGKPPVLYPSKDTVAGTAEINPVPRPIDGKKLYFHNAGGPKKGDEVVKYYL